MELFLMSLCPQPHPNFNTSAALISDFFFLFSTSATDTSLTDPNHGDSAELHGQEISRQ
jgi:hypothetical protein